MLPENSQKILGYRSQDAKLKEKQHVDGSRLRFSKLSVSESQFSGFSKIAIFHFDNCGKTIGIFE